MISVVLAGSSAAWCHYPSAASWELILSALWAQYPDAVLCLIDKLGEDGRTTSRVGRAELTRLFALSQHRRLTNRLSYCDAKPWPQPSRRQ